MATDMREEQRASVLSRATEAVTRSFTERDKGIKISDASAEMGIHIGSIYNKFRDKEDIVCEIVIRHYALMLGRSDRVDAEDFVRRWPAIWRRSSVWFGWVRMSRGSSPSHTHRPRRWML